MGCPWEKGKQRIKDDCSISGFSNWVQDRAIDWEAAEKEKELVGGANRESNLWNFFLLKFEMFSVTVNGEGRQGLDL